MKTKFLILILITGLLSACGGSPTQLPASSPADEPVSVTEAPATPSASTDTPIPPTEIPEQEPITESVVTATVSFTNDILPILNSRCLNCHGGDRIEEGLVVRTYADLMAGSDNGPVLVPGSAENSLFVELVVNREMPKRGPKLTPPQVQLLIDWVNQGALDN